jgi:hypothetical protein
VLIQPRLGVPQIERVEPLSEPAVNQSKQLARLLPLALVTPEARDADGCAEFPGFCLLLASDGERMLELLFCVSDASTPDDLRAISPAMRFSSASHTADSTRTCMASDLHYRKSGRE